MPQPPSSDRHSGLLPYVLMTTTSTAAPTSGAPTSRAADIAAFVAGGLAAALGVAIGELVAGIVFGAPSLIIAIGDFVIDNQPPGAKELVVDLFGDTKTVLNIGILIAVILIAGALGVVGRRNWTVPVAGFIAAGLFGIVAALSQPLYDPVLSIVTVGIAMAVALGALRVMLRATSPAWAPATATAAAAPAVPAEEMPDWDRRRFLQVSGGVAASSIVLGLVGRNLLNTRPGGAGEDVVLPTAAGPVPEDPGWCLARRRRHLPDRGPQR